MASHAYAAANKNGKTVKCSKDYDVIGIWL